MARGLAVLDDNPCRRGERLWKAGSWFVRCQRRPVRWCQVTLGRLFRCELYSVRALLFDAHSNFGVVFPVNACSNVNCVAPRLRRVPPIPKRYICYGVAVF